jgi:hypothetical protein
MISIGRSLGASAGIALAAIAVAGCGSSGPPSTPQRTIETFVRASAAGDAATACAQLSAQAKREVMQGVSCEQGIRLGASVYGSIIKQIQVTGLTTLDQSATGISTLNGLPTATFKLRRRGGRWLIVDEHRASSSTASSSPASSFAAGSSPASSSPASSSPASSSPASSSPASSSTAGALAADSSGPSESRVETVAGCLDGTFEAVDDSGPDSTGGVAHVVLVVSIGGQSVAEVDVFASALAALSGYETIKAYEGSLTTKLASTSVIVYLKTVPADKQQAIESCG